MEHHPYITLNDHTEITYSDIKRDINKREYVTIYFETPVETGFHSMDIQYPDGKPEHVIGYTKEEMDTLMYHYRKIGKLAFQFAKEEKINHA